MKKFTLVLVGMLMAGKVDAQALTKSPTNKEKADSIRLATLECLYQERTCTAGQLRAEVLRRNQIRDTETEYDRLQRKVLTVVIGTTVLAIVLSRVNMKNQRNNGYDGPCPDYYSRARDGSLCGYRAAPYR